jgi:alpha-tubulin suppressor-like RCC1 family protein
MSIYVKVDNVWKNLSGKVGSLEIYACGSNNNGQLGLGDTAHRSTLTQVGTDTNWKSVSCGYQQILAIKTNGTIWACGLNHLGQLGLGDTANRSTLTQIGTDTNWESIDGSESHTGVMKLNLST